MGTQTIIFHKVKCLKRKYNLRDSLYCFECVTYPNPRFGQICQICKKYISIQYYLYPSIRMIRLQHDATYVLRLPICKWSCFVETGCLGLEDRFSAHQFLRPDSLTWQLAPSGVHPPSFLPRLHLVLSPTKSYNFAQVVCHQNMKYSCPHSWIKLCHMQLIALLNSVPRF